MLILALAVLVLLTASATTSGTEAAIFSVPLIKAKELAVRHTAAGRALLKIRENMRRPIAAIVVLNNVANIVGSIVVGMLAASILGNRWIGVFTAVLTLLVIVFAEIVPKTVGERHAVSISLFVARPLIGVTRLLTPLLWMIETITRPFTRGRRPSHTVKESEITLLAQMGQQEGSIAEQESELIRRTFQLDETAARDLLTPRVAMTSLNANDTLEQVKDSIIASQHSRMVVVRESPDDVVGIALQVELLTALIQGKGHVKVAEFVDDVQFIPESTRADRLLAVFRKSRQHIAVVLDEFGGVAGVVTLEDVLEVLTGEIVDETDVVVDLRADARSRQSKRHEP